MPVLKMNDIEQRVKAIFLIKLLKIQAKDKNFFRKVNTFFQQQQQLRFLVWSRLHTTNTIIGLGLVYQMCYYLS